MAVRIGVREGCIPPTSNYETRDPTVTWTTSPTRARSARLDTAVINGFGFGGQNAVAVFRRFEA